MGHHSLLFEKIKGFHAVQRDSFSIFAILHKCSHLFRCSPAFCSISIPLEKVKKFTKSENVFKISFKYNKIRINILHLEKKLSNFEEHTFATNTGQIP